MNKNNNNNNNKNKNKNNNNLIVFLAYSFVNIFEDFFPQYNFIILLFWQ